MWTVDDLVKLPTARFLHIAGDLPDDAVPVVERQGSYYVDFHVTRSESHPLHPLRSYSFALLSDVRTAAAECTGRAVGMHGYSAYRLRWTEWRLQATHSTGDRRVSRAWMWRYVGPTPSTVIDYELIRWAMRKDYRTRVEAVEGLSKTLCSNARFEGRRRASSVLEAVELGQNALAR